MHPSSTDGVRRHLFKFDTFGHTHHLKIDTFDDLKMVLQLDEAHWVATTAPLATLNADPEFLSLMDSDQDGRLRAEEVKDAIRFLIENLTDSGGVVAGNTCLRLDAINTASAAGRQIHMIVYQAYILVLVNSFVSFPTLYDPNSRALFEMGTLVMDGRHFTLAVKVLDRERHVQSSVASHLFVMYLQIYGDSGETSYDVAVRITSGNRGNIRLDKWGIFNDVNGKEWHAKVVQIIENPISLGEAMVLPFVRAAQSFMVRLEGFSNKAGEKLGLRSPANDSKGKNAAEKDQKKGAVTSTGLLAGWGVTAAARICFRHGTRLRHRLRHRHHQLPVGRV